MRDFIPAVWNANEVEYKGWRQSAENLINCRPIILNDNQLGATIRDEHNTVGLAATASTNRGRGIHFFRTISVAVRETLYNYSGGSQDLTATSSPGYVGNTGFNEEYLASFCRHLVSGVENLVIVSAGHTSTNASANHGNLWYVADDVSAPSSVSDAHMPGNNGVSIIRGGASLKGYFFLCDINGRIHNSTLNDITAWDEADFLTAEGWPDIGVYLGKHHDHLVYIGTQSIEFFYLISNPPASGSPLALRTDVSYSIGCLFPNTVLEIGDDIYFVGVDKAGWPRVYRLSNFQLSIISTPQVDDFLRAPFTSFDPLSGGIDNLFTTVWLTDIYADDSFGLLLTVSSLRTFYYHAASNIWSVWSFDATVTYGGPIGTAWTDVYPICSSSRGPSALSTRVQFVNGETSIASAKDNDAINDLGSSNAAIPYIVFPTWDAGTDKKKRVTSVRVVTEPIATDSAVNTTLTANLRWIDLERESDNTASFPDNYTTARNIDLNTRGARLFRCGSTRSRRFLLAMPLGHGPVTAVKGLEINYDIVE